MGTLRLSAVTAACLLLGCSVEDGATGEPCQRSSQCDPGLACVEQTCTDDLSALSDQSEVPELVPEPTDAGQDAGGDAASGPGQDAAPPDEDAG